MKRAIGLIAATLVSASIYSQDYSSSSGSNPDSTPDYRSRQSESGAPASSDSSASSSSTTSASGYDRAPGLSGGNSSTGQSNGSNVGSASDQDQSLTTRDSDLSGGEYRGSVQSEPERSFNSELNSDSSSSSQGSSGSSASGSTSSSDATLRGSGTADGAFHEPAAPVREGSTSEGWSGSGTFSGAGPGSVSGSASSTDSSSLNSSSASDSIPAPTESSNSFRSDVSGNAALEHRDQDLTSRGLEPDSNSLTRDEALFNRVQNDFDGDSVIMEDWTIITPDSNVGGPAESESGAATSSDSYGADHFDSSVNSSSNGEYGHDLYNRTQKNWQSGSERSDVRPMTPGVMDHEFDHLRLYNSDTQSDVGGPGASVSGSKSSSDAECDVHKGSAAEYEQGTSDSDQSVKSSSQDQSSGRYHINRGEDDKYHVNREASGDRGSDSTSAPGEYGDRPTSSNYDDGHLNGNNAAGSSDSSESSPSSSSTASGKQQPDL